MSDKRNGALVGGWCCLVIAVLLAIWQPITFAIYVPMFLAAFVLAIVAIAQRRITSGVILLLLSIILPIGAVSYGVTSAWRGVSNVAAAGSSPSTANAPTASPSQTWHYAHWADPMGRGTTRIAEVDSTNVLNFGFPYAGEQHARFAIVNSAKYGLQVRLTIHSGQFMCPSYRGCTVQVRLDDEPVVAMRAAPSDDGDSTVLFLTKPKAVVADVLKAKIFRVEAPFWQEGTQILSFPVADLDAVKVLTPTKAR